MKVLITGGAGYIGTELIHKLACNKEVEQITVYDNLSRGNYNLFLHDKIKGKVKFVHADILDSRQMRKSLSGIDTVYHLAAKVTTPFANIDAHFYEQVNHWGTAELVYALEESDVSRLIFVSSTAVYGSLTEAMNEDTPTNPVSFYGISKLRAEEHVMRLFEKMNALIIRCSNVYGYSTSMRFDAVINKFMFDANFFNRIHISGNGNQFRAFISIDDVSDALCELAVAKIPSGIYNLSDLNFEIAYVAQTMKEIFPGLEFLFINQHIQMQQQIIDTNLILKKYIQLHHTDFKTELIQFKEKFSF